MLLLTLTHLLQKTGVTQTISATIVAASLLGTQALDWQWSRDAELEKNISIWGTNLIILDRNKVKGWAEGKQRQTNTSLEHVHPAPHLVSPTGDLPTCQTGPRGLEWISGTLEDYLPPIYPHYNSGLFASGVWNRGTQFESQFCHFLAMWSEAGNYPLLHLSHDIMLLIMRLFWIIMDIYSSPCKVKVLWNNNNNE